MKLVTNERTSARFVVLLTLAYVVVTAWMAMHHEPWRDEADPWLYVRDANLATILARTRYAGLPALWFLCLTPLAKLGLPYASQKVLHLIVAAAAVAVFAARAPLTRLTKVLAAASYYLAYEYAIIVRSYGLTVLLTFIAAAMFSKRRERPIAFAVVLFLLFNVNAQGFVIAGAFAASFVLEMPRFARLLAVRAEKVDMDPRAAERGERGRKPGDASLPAIAIMAAGAVLSFLQVRTPPDPARHMIVHVFNRDAFAWVVGNAFVPTLPWPMTFIIGLAVLIAITIAVWRSRDALLMLWLPVAGLSIVYTYIWLGGLRHAGFFLILVLVAVWIAGDRVQKPLVAALLLNATLVVSDLEALRYAVADTRAAFSGAEEMAQFIRANHLDAYDIAAHNLTQCEALLPYLDTPFWYAGLGEYGTYMKWDSSFERALNVSYPEAELRARQHFATKKKWLLLFNVEMPDPPAHGFRLLYTNQRHIFEKTDERYWLYAPLR